MAFVHVVEGTLADALWHNTMPQPRFARAGTKIQSFDHSNQHIRFYTYQVTFGPGLPAAQCVRQWHHSNQRIRAGTAPLLGSVSSRGVRFRHFSSPVQTEIQCQPKMSSKRSKTFRRPKKIQMPINNFTFTNCYLYAFCSLVCHWYAERSTRCNIVHWTVVHKHDLLRSSV